MYILIQKIPSSESGHLNIYQNMERKTIERPCSKNSRLSVREFICGNTKYFFKVLNSCTSYENWIINVLFDKRLSDETHTSRSSTIYSLITSKTRVKMPLVYRNKIQSTAAMLLIILRIFLNIYLTFIINYMV